MTTFEGFTPPIDDYFRMPNAWINICAEIDSLSELKVVQYVLRHTWGYQEFSGARKITIDEFMHGRKRKDGTRIDNGTGLSKQSVITAVAAAITHGYLVCDKDDHDLARKKKYYQLAMSTDVKHLDTISDVKHLDIGLDVQNLDIPDVKHLDLDVKHLDSRGQEFRQRSEKDTIERHYRKTDQRHESTVQDATALAPYALESVIEVEMTSQSTKGREDEQPLSLVPPSSVQAPRPPSGTGDHSLLPQVLTPPVVVESPLPPLVATPASLGTDTPVRPQRKPKPVKDATVAASPMPQCDVHELRRRINARRGYALEEKIEIIRENQATKAWSALHTLDDYEIVMRELACDPYWGKPENISRVGGVTLQKETPRLLAKVRTGNRQPATGSAYSAEIVTRFGTATSRAEFAAEFYPSEAERRMQNAAKA